MFSTDFIFRQPKILLITKTQAKFNSPKKTETLKKKNYDSYVLQNNSSFSLFLLLIVCVTIYFRQFKKLELLCSFHWISRWIKPNTKHQMSVVVFCCHHNLEKRRSLASSLFEMPGFGWHIVFGIWFLSRRLKKWKKKSKNEVKKSIYINWL